MKPADKIFLEQFDTHFDRINEELNRGLSSHISLMEKIGSHSLLGEGKRIRPLLFLLSARLCGYEGGDIYHLSTIFELIHTASLLHDDVLDNADTRRRKPSANNMWGNHAAVLGGDFLYSRSFEIAVGSGSVPFLQLLTQTTTRMAEGQILELMHTHNWKLGKDEYLEIVTAKTAVLISAACACGAIISRADRDFIKHLSRFGLNMGIAFQLIDDLLDYTGSEKVFGKPVGKDLKEGKITLPLIYALGEMRIGEIERLETSFKNREADDDEYQEVISLVRQNGVAERVRAEAKIYVDEAEDYLDSLPDSPVRENLQALNQYILTRDY
jgi:octaprenyl-diphosphate synthase